MMQEAIREHQLQGVVVAACSPRMHEPTFRRAAGDAGITPYMCEMANLREHCSWVHEKGDATTAKAADLIRIEDGLPISERIVLKSRPTIRISREKPAGLKRFLDPGLALIVLVIAGAVFSRVISRHRASSPAPKIPDSIAVISFENLTGDENLDLWSKRGIPERLITNLENTGYFRVFTWEQMRDALKKMGHTDIKYIDSDLGFELCRRAGIVSLVTGSLTKAEDTFALDMRLLDAETMPAALAF